MIVTKPFNGPQPGQGASGVHQLRIEDMARDVVEFHKKYGIQYEGKPRHLDAETATLRIHRSLEEHQEYLDSHELVEKFDALLDHIYILLGTAHLHGFTPEMIYEGWSRIQRANMAKELSSPLNPGKYNHKQDIVKPIGCQAADHTDIIK